MLRKRILTTTAFVANLAIISCVVLLVVILSGRIWTRGLNITTLSTFSASLLPQGSTNAGAVDGDSKALPVKEAVFNSPELKAEIENNKNVVILDIRSREEFARGHIPSAINIPQDEMHTRALDELPESKLLVVSSYECSNDEISNIVRDELTQLGFGKVAVLKRGINGWSQAGFETATSAYTEPRLYTPSDQTPNQAAQNR